MKDIDIKLEKVNESWVRVICSTSILLELREKFSFMADGYRFNPKYTYGHWDGKICMMNKELLPLGLVEACLTIANSYDYTVDIDPALKHDPFFTKDEYFKEWIESHPVYDKDKTIEPYWYQQDAIRYAIDKKRCILNLPTSAGKSLIQGMLCKWYTEVSKKNVLILVPTVALTDQMADDFVNYRLFDYDDINIVRGGSTDNEGRITIGTWQSIAKRDKKYMNQFGMILIDECHLSTGPTIKKIINSLTNCEYKIGLSGSLKDGKANSMTYVGCMGSVFAPVTTRQLADGGYIANLDIKMLFLKYNKDTCKTVKGYLYQEEIKYITDDTKRLNLVTKLSAKLASNNENVLLLFRHVKHGMKLYDKLCKIHGEENVEFIDGSVKREKRVDISKTTENSNGRIIVASYGTTSTGISIKKLHHVVLAHPVKSKITVIQSIGRLLRKHDTKAKATIWDIVDNLTVKNKNGKYAKKKNYSYLHGLERMQMYIAEQFDYKTREIEL